MLILHARALVADSLREVCVRTENGVITDVAETLAPRAGEETLDFTCDWLLPGFVDVHIHAFQGADTMRGENDVRRMSRGLYEIGVAAFQPTTMSASPEDTTAALAGVAAVMTKPEPRGARVVGAHMEAPFLAPSKCGAQVASHFALPSIEAFERYTGAYGSAARMMTVAPELPDALPMIRELTARGMVISVGHTEATAEDVHRAGDAGANHVTHLFNAQTPLNHRAPGVPGAAMSDARFFCELICDGIHLHPDVVRVAVAAMGAKRVVAITDAMEAAGMPDGEYALGGQKVFVRDGAARLASGTLAGSTLTMRRALQNLAGRFGIAPETAIRMTTQTPAASIGLSGYGVIEKGACALPLQRYAKDWTFVGLA